MINNSDINKIMNSYIDMNKKLISEKSNTLEVFRKKENSLRGYVDILTDLEKKQQEINLSEFKNLKMRTVEILSMFNTEDIEVNINNVRDTIIFFEQIEKDFVEVFNSFNSTKRLWKSFVKENKLEDTVFDIHIKKMIISLNEMIEAINPSEINSLGSSLELLRAEVEKVILRVSKVYDYTDRNIFLGEENEKYLIDMKNTIKNPENMSLFNEKSEEFFISLDKIKEESKLKIVPIPVIYMVNSGDSSIKKATVVFGDYILKFDTFFNSSKLKKIDTNQFIYLKDFPTEGIFSGREIVEKLEYSDNYILAVNKFISKANNTFIIIGFSLIASGVYASFHGDLATTIHLGITIASIPIYAYIYLPLLKKRMEWKYKVKNMFLFRKIDLYILKRGDLIDLRGVALGIINKIDKTILNKEYHKWRKENFVVKKKKKKKDKGNGLLSKLSGKIFNKNKKKNKNGDK